MKRGIAKERGGRGRQGLVVRLRYNTVSAWPYQSRAGNFVPSLSESNPYSGASPPLDYIGKGCDARL